MYEREVLKPFKSFHELKEPKLRAFSKDIDQRLVKMNNARCSLFERLESSPRPGSHKAGAETARHLTRGLLLFEDKGESKENLTRN
jgi:hypothetical protein